jgi:hypothetical protein
MCLGDAKLLRLRLVCAALLLLWDIATGRASVYSPTPTLCRLQNWCKAAEWRILDHVTPARALQQSTNVAWQTDTILLPSYHPWPPPIDSPRFLPSSAGLLLNSPLLHLRIAATPWYSTAAATRVCPAHSLVRLSHAPCAQCPRIAARPCAWTSRIGRCCQSWPWLEWIRTR